MSLIYLSHPPPSEEGETRSEAEGVGTSPRRPFLHLNATQPRTAVNCDGVLTDVAAQLGLRAAWGPCLPTQGGSHSHRQRSSIPGEPVYYL